MTSSLSLNEAKPLPPMPAHPAAWVGTEIATHSTWQFVFNAAQISELEAAAEHFQALKLPHAALARVDSKTLASELFPLPRLAPLLGELKNTLLHGRGFSLMRGLPVARYTVEEAALIFMGIGSHLGRARSQNARGHLLGHVCDLGVSSADPNVRIYQTNERQTFHTDSCDVVGLLCLRNAKAGGDSLLVSALTLYQRLYAQRPDLLARLLQPMPHDRRGEVPQGQKPYFEIPVYSWFEHQLTVFYQRQYFDSAQRFADARRLTASDVEALNYFDALANDQQLSLTMRLEPGDMQWVHNHVLLHDRTGFVDWPQQAQRRHLLRLWLACEGARALPPSFAPRYGALTIGDRGGIVVPDMQLTVPLSPL